MTEYPKSAIGGLLLNEICLRSFDRMYKVHEASVFFYSGGITLNFANLRFDIIKPNQVPDVVHIKIPLLTCRKHYFSYMCHFDKENW